MISSWNNDLNVSQETKTQPLLISVSGLYRTGSSAVIDLIEEYENTRIIKEEFKPFEAGLLDIISNIYNGIGVTDKYFNSIKKATLGYSENPSYILRLINKITLNKSSLIREKIDNHRKYSNIFLNYKEVTNLLFNELFILNNSLIKLDNISSKDISVLLCNYFSKLLLNNYNDNRVPVLNQLIKPGKIIPKLFPQAKIVYLFRDPRDQFCDIVNMKHPKPRFCGSNRAEVFVREYVQRYSKVNEVMKEAPDNVLGIQFEDLSYNYKKTREMIEKHLVLKNRECSQFSRFNPERAIASTQIYKKHTDSSEIKLIETELKNWLYSFPK